MHILTKSLIGLAATGATAVGGYYGFQALREESIENWSKNNKAWFDKWSKFRSETDRDEKATLRGKWSKLSSSFKSGNSLSDYELAREFQKWCTINEANNSDYSEIKSGIC